MVFSSFIFLFGYFPAVLLLYFAVPSAMKNAVYCHILELILLSSRVQGSSAVCRDLYSTLDRWPKTYQMIRNII